MSGPEVLTPVQLRMMLPLGQIGAACYAHTPRRVDEIEYVAPPARVVLVAPRPVVVDDGVPRTVGWLVRERGGEALYGAVLCPLGKGVGLDRWLLAEWVLVHWRGGRATWKRVGAATRWVPVDRPRTVEP